MRVSRAGTSDRFNRNPRVDGRACGVCLRKEIETCFLEEKECGRRSRKAKAKAKLKLS